MGEILFWVHKDSATPGWWCLTTKSLMKTGFFDDFCASKKEHSTSSAEDIFKKWWLNSIPCPTFHTVDASEIWRTTTFWMFIKCVVKNGISTHQAQLLDPPRFLNHQQCYQCEPKKKLLNLKRFMDFLPSSWIIGFFNPQKNHLSKLPSQNHFCPEIYVSLPRKKKVATIRPAAKKHDKKPETILLLFRGAKVYPLCCKTSRSLASRFVGWSWTGWTEGWGRLGKVDKVHSITIMGLYIYSVNQKSWW